MMANENEGMAIEIATAKVTASLNELNAFSLAGGSHWIIPLVDV